MDEVVHALDRIKAWMRTQAMEQADPEDDDDGGQWMVDNSFHPPASENEITALEATLGFAIPAELRSLLSVHNSTAVQIIEGEWDLLGASQVGTMWSSMNSEFAEDSELHEGVQPDPGVRRYWSHPKWLPIAQAGGDYILLDLNPAEGGTIGQLIYYYRDIERRERVATGLGAWLSGFADALEAGKYRIEEGDIEKV